MKPLPEDLVADELRRKRRPRGEVAGVALAVVLGVALAVWGSQVLFVYGWGLFLGVPFLTGFVASWFLNAKTTQSLLNTIAVSALTPFLIGLALLGFGREGVICLLMAVPLALPFSIAGGLVARCILQRRHLVVASPTFAACVALLPLMMIGEQAAKLDPPVNAVTTSITIDAPVSVVWKNVIAFPPLAPPDEWLFRAGIAYPTSGRIVGSGPGAVRYCHFSTGDFVEPITVWDENRLLAFDVCISAAIHAGIEPVEDHATTSRAQLHAVAARPVSAGGVERPQHASGGDDVVSKLLLATGLLAWVVGRDPASNSHAGAEAR